MDVFADRIESDKASLFYFRKDRGETVIIVLGPVVERMVVTVGTTYFYAQQRFGNKFGLKPSVAGGSIKVCRPNFVRVTFRQEQLG